MSQYLYPLAEDAEDRASVDWHEHDQVEHGHFRAVNLEIGEPVYMTDANGDAFSRIVVSAPLACTCDQITSTGALPKGVYRKQIVDFHIVHDFVGTSPRKVFMTNFSRNEDTNTQTITLDVEHGFRVSIQAITGQDNKEVSGFYLLPHAEAPPPEPAKEETESDETE